MKIGYSDTYSTEKSQYRYNYNTCQLEKIGKKIRMMNSGGNLYPVVETGIVASYSIDPRKFDRAPMFWVILYEEAKKRKES